MANLVGTASKSISQPSTSSQGQLEEEESYNFAVDVEKRKVIILKHTDYDPARHTILDLLPSRC